MVQTAARISADGQQVKQQMPRWAVVNWLAAQIGAEAVVALGEAVSAVLDAEVAELLGRPWRQGVESRQLGEAGEVVCGRCGRHAQGDFWRNGHWRRRLVTPAGEAQVRVPMLECRECRAGGHWEHGLWRRLDRLVGDWPEVVRRWVQHGSLRAFGRHLAEELGVGVAVSTLAKRLAQAEAAYEHWRNRPLAETPPVLAVDGLHFTVGKGRNRKGHHACAVVVLGLWPGGEKEKTRVEILDFELGEKEDEETCRRLFARLYERGLEAPGLVISDDNNAYRAAAELVWGPVPWQLCTNHKLRAAREHAPAGSKQEFMTAAAAIFEAPSRAEAEARAQALARDWHGRASGAVQSLMRKLPRALTFYDWPESWRRSIRTNNAAESGMRCLRDALRRAGGCPGSAQGALGILFAATLAFNHDDYP